MIVYQEYAPLPALRPWLACVWTCRVQAGNTVLRHQVLPDNCIDILCQDQQETSFAVGMMTAPINVVSQGLVQTVAARFKPGAAASFFDLPLCELNDGRTDLQSLWGRDMAMRLTDALWSDPLDDLQRIAILQDHLLQRLRSGPPPSAAGITGQAITLIEQTQGRLRVASLAEQLKVSRQHLALQFRHKVGLSPKLFARICRFRAANATLQRLHGAPDWAQLALEHGYFDQSHLIHDFQDFAHSAPETWLAGKQL
ncbi:MULTISPECIES: helix-turn-helix domain-containing protein [unclassified Janthinobacterium]|uniref:AraC family transcriptional regulator n=1 Tax=unclassified Janthinobacterium TaxID=2610881 RepID=UPI001854BCC8|nr:MULTISPECIES: helix-turn-helix domain-containing protein [unclassified Janthinobacterium]MBB5371124.1 AraC-like DNA-binding protein [Janthinobacterium sp. K2C7]MBB5383930.1 AraC-like DNA-binding protein [Janthinobacterium sp. K2Li3]MBB5389248.1 AraC-like DNA-binding protein [Janthinobacterium sp. K2E3]